MIKHLLVPGITLSILSSLPVDAVFAQTLSENAPTLERAAPLIAEILFDLEHFPTDEEKETLAQISGNNVHSEAIRSIAQAAHEFRHTVPADYRDELQRIVENEYATAREKALADVLLEIEHTPNQEQKNQLAQVQ